MSSLSLFTSIHNHKGPQPYLFHSTPVSPTPTTQNKNTLTIPSDTVKKIINLIDNKIMLSSGIMFDYCLLSADLHLLCFVKNQEQPNPLWNCFFENLTDDLADIFLDHALFEQRQLEIKFFQSLHFDLC
jgi:hypothetical protein